MNRIHFAAAIISLVLVPLHASAQSHELPKYEVGAEFTTLERDSVGQRTEPGLGARFTVNLNESFAFETAGYVFPKKCFSCANNGRMTEALAGVKVGKRFEKWGIFAKARPGVVSFSRGHINPVPAAPGSPFPFDVEVKRVTSFAADLGAVVEFYPSRKLVTRFDVGDTIIHFTRRTTNAIAFDPSTGSVTLFPFTRPARTTHNFQFIASVGFRF